MIIVMHLQIFNTENQLYDFQNLSVKFILEKNLEISQISFSNIFLNNKKKLSTYLKEVVEMDAAVPQIKILFTYAWWISGQALDDSII